MGITIDTPDQNYAVDYLYKLMILAEARTEKLGIPFKREDYKWILGARVINDISISNDLVMTACQDCPRTLYGIVVEADYANPNNVQLWENITNKV